MIKAIIFDFDGVLVDSVDIKTAAFAELFEPEGEDVVSKVVHYHLNNTGVSRYDKFRYIYKEILHRHLSDDEFNILCGRFANIVVDAVVKAPYVKGAKEFLDKYHKEYALFIASATPQQEIEKIVAQRGMSCLFRSIYGAPKKKTDAIMEIMVTEKIDPSQVIYIGDAMSDYYAALDNGVNFIARVQSGNPIFDNIQCRRMDDLKDLFEMLQSIDKTPYKDGLGYQ